MLIKDAQHHGLRVRPNEIPAARNLGFRAPLPQLIGFDAHHEEGRLQREEIDLSYRFPLPKRSVQT